MTSQHAYFIVSRILFGLVALLHDLRLASHCQVRINVRQIPMWFPWVVSSLPRGCATGHSGCCSDAAFIMTLNTRGDSVL
jgi:hypothetical protein